MQKTLIFDRNYQESELTSLAGLVLPLLQKYQILLLKGDLGSGKTSFIKSLLSQAGLDEEVTSPTFNLVNEYRMPDGSVVYHFDLYRIKHPEELDEMGFYEYLDSGKLCLIEWPEQIENSLPVPHLKLQLFHQEYGRRYVLEQFEEKLSA